VQGTEINNINNNDDRETRFKDFYREAMAARGKRQVDDARKLGLSQGMISNFMDPTSPYYMGIHHLPDSLVKDDILGWLANECSVIIIPHNGTVNGTVRDELSQILKACAEITRNEDDKDAVKKAANIIAKMAERIIEEKSK
jgi:predicted transcriptional regulator